VPTGRSIFFDNQLADFDFDTRLPSNNSVSYDKIHLV